MSNRLGFTCRSCKHPDMTVRVDRPGIIQTVLELFCPECGAVFRPSLMFESNNLILEDKPE